LRQAGQASGIAQSGKESNWIVSVLSPVETVAALTGQRIMMSGIAPPFFRRPDFRRPVFKWTVFRWDGLQMDRFGRSRADQWEF
jgi:hypothetical protein